MKFSVYGKGYLVQGTDTKQHKQQLKDLGGSWNRHLQGWVFSPSKYEDLRKICETFEDTQTGHQNSLCHTSTPIQPFNKEKTIDDSKLDNKISLSISDVEENSTNKINDMEHTSNKKIFVYPKNSLPSPNKKTSEKEEKLNKNYDPDGLDLRSELARLEDKLSNAIDDRDRLLVRNGYLLEEKEEQNMLVEQLKSELVEANENLEFNKKFKILYEELIIAKKYEINKVDLIIVMSTLLIAIGFLYAKLDQISIDL